MSSSKVFVIGLDGMDPSLTKKYMDQGKMPNVKKLVEAGACREDLVMLGGHPTVTPPMWTTLATGANPVLVAVLMIFALSSALATPGAWMMDKLNELDSKIDGLNTQSPSIPTEQWMNLKELCDYIPSHPAEQTQWWYGKP